jgi:hypothetical protein
MALKDAFKQYSAASDEAKSTVSGLAARGQAVKEYNDAVAPAPVPAAPAAKSKPVKSDLVNPNSKGYGDRKGEKRIDTSDMTKPLGSFKKGGKVKKTGVYKLHKKEVVVPAKKASGLAKMFAK